MLSGGIGKYSSRLKVTTPRKLEPLFAVHPDQLAVDADRRGAGGEAEDRLGAGGAPGGDDVRDPAGDGAGERLVALENDGRDLLESGGGIGHGGNL